MRIDALKRIEQKTFSLVEAAQALGLDSPSARVACHRYVKAGYLLRLKRGVYALRDDWRHFSFKDLAEIANRLQVPSYVSFATALSYYELTTQVQRNFLESAALTRTRTFEAEKTVFRYIRLNKNLYFGFIKKDNLYIAEPEKALLDSLYLMSLYRYRLDLPAVDKEKFNKKKLAFFSRRFPARTRELLGRLCRI